MRTGDIVLNVYYIVNFGSLPELVLEILPKVLASCMFAVQNAYFEENLIKVLSNSLDVSFSASRCLPPHYAAKRIKTKNECHTYAKHVHETKGKRTMKALSGRRYI